MTKARPFGAMPDGGSPVEANLLKRLISLELTPARTAIKCMTDNGHIVHLTPVEAKSTETGWPVTFAVS